MQTATARTRARLCKPISKARAVGKQLDEKQVAMVVAAFREMAVPNATVAVALLKEKGLTISVPTACKYALAAGINLGGQGRRFGATNVDGAPGAKWSRLREKILVLYKEGRGDTVAEIHRKLGCSRALIHRYIAEAEAEKD